MIQTTANITVTVPPSAFEGIIASLTTIEVAYVAVTALGAIWFGRVLMSMWAKATKKQRMAADFLFALLNGTLASDYWLDDYMVGIPLAIATFAFYAALIAWLSREASPPYRKKFAHWMQGEFYE